MASLLNIDESAAPPPPPNDAAPPPPPPPPSSDGQQQEDAPPERPDFIPESAWGEHGYDKAKHLEALRAETRPADPSAYTLPEVDGIDLEEAAASPLFTGLRVAAHKAGLDQDAFNEVATEFFTQSKKVADEAVAKEVEKLGENAAARLTAVNAWLGSALPTAQAKGLAAIATTADAVIALEALMKQGPVRKAGGEGGNSGGGGGGGTARKSRAEIEAIMQTKEYRGKANERVPAVIAEVDAWFQEEARLKRDGKK